MTTWTNPMIGNHDGTGQKYGDPRDGGARIHRGYDIGTAGVTGRPVVAGGSGTVRIAGYANVRGNHVLIDHGDGYRTLYQHLASMSVGVGQTVATGQQIGICGGTGGSYPIHLHLQVFARGTGTSLNDDADTIDPKPFFRDRGITLGVTTPATPTTPTNPDTKDWFDMASLDDLRSLLGTELASVVRQVNARSSIIIRRKDGQMRLVNGKGAHVLTSGEWQTLSNLGYEITHNNMDPAPFDALVVAFGGPNA